MKISFRYIALLIVSVFLVQQTIAQEKKVNAAATAYNDYLKDRKGKDLQRARKEIDAAVNHPESVKNPKAWMMHGNIYMELFISDFAEKKEEAIERKSVNAMADAYCNVTDSFLTIAGRSYETALRLDTANNWKHEITTGITRCVYEQSNMGASLYNGSACESKAVDCFYECYKLNMALNKFDTASLYNATIAAMKVNDFKRAIIWANNLALLNYEGSNSWWLLGECYIRNGDTSLARIVVNNCRIRFPNEPQLNYMYIDYELAVGNSGAADSIVMKMIGRTDLNDAVSCCEVGNVYDQLANPVAADGSFLARPWNYPALISRAEFYYKRAILLKPDYFDAQYNLAVLYYNQGAYIYNQQAAAPDPDNSWEPLIISARDEFEKARMLRPDDYNTLVGLKTCYHFLGDSARYQEVKQAMDNLNGK